MLYNNSNSNGGNIEKDDENINESDNEDDKIKPINHCILNANCENNKLENTYDDIRINILNLEKNTNNNKYNNKNQKVAPLNLVEILNNDNLQSTDLNSNESPTHISSFSLYKIHQKYFKKIL